MLRLLSLMVSSSYRRPKIMNLSNLIKRQVTGKSEVYHGEKLTLKISPPVQKKQIESISWKEVNNSINKSQETLTRQELGINRLIKIQTNSSSLYELFKLKYSSLSAKNAINLIIKMLQLRHINGKNSEQVDKLDKIVAFAYKKLNKMTPQDMIRFLFCLKNANINTSDLTRISSFIMTIIKEFSGRSFIKGYDTPKTFESFQVMSVESTLKLIHSLEYLHEITGREYQPQIVQLIKQTLNYFHSFFNSPTKNPQGNKNPKYIKWSFYYSLITLVIKYQLPVQVVSDFLKALYPLKKSFVAHHETIINLLSEISKMTVGLQLREEKVSQHRQLFYLHQVVYQIVQKPEQLIKINPYVIMKYLELIEDFSDKQLALLGFEQLKKSIVSKIISFTLKTFQKYLSKDYTSQLQKSAVQDWIEAGKNNKKEYLGYFLLFFHLKMKENKQVYTSQINKILNLCLEFYSQLSFNSKAVVLQISFERNFKNLKFIIDLFFNKQETKNQPQTSKRVKLFSKYQQIQSYIKLFAFWKQINEFSKLNFDQYREGTFIKAFLRAIIYLPNLQNYPQLFAKRIQLQPQILSLFIKKFKRHSLQNRSLSKVFIDLVQQAEFRKQLSQITQILKNPKGDTFKLSKYSQLKYTIRQKIKRSLKIFKFSMMLLQTLGEKKIVTFQNITHSEYFVQIVSEFQQQLQCLYYKQLYTVEIYELAAEISQYLKSKSDVNYRVSNIQKEGQTLNIKLDVKQGEGLLGFIANKADNQTKRISNH